MQALAAEQIGAWERNGFLKVENFVDADELANIRRIMEGLVERDPPHENTLIDIDPVLADRTDIPRTEKFRALMHAAHASRELLETYTLRPRTLDVVEDLIGPDLVYYTDQTFLKPPGGSGAPCPPGQRVLGCLLVRERQALGVAGARRLHHGTGVHPVRSR